MHEIKIVLLDGRTFKDLPITHDNLVAEAVRLQFIDKEQMGEVSMSLKSHFIVDENKPFYNELINTFFSFTEDMQIKAKAAYGLGDPSQFLERIVESEEGDNVWYREQLYIFKTNEQTAIYLITDHGQTPNVNQDNFNNNAEAVYIELNQFFDYLESVYEVYGLSVAENLLNIEYLNDSYAALDGNRLAKLNLVSRLDQQFTCHSFYKKMNLAFGAGWMYSLPPRIKSISTFFSMPDDKVEKIIELINLNDMTVMPSAYYFLLNDVLDTQTKHLETLKNGKASRYHAY